MAYSSINSILGGKGGGSAPGRAHFVPEDAPPVEPQTTSGKPTPETNPEAKRKEAEKLGPPDKRGGAP